MYTKLFKEFFDNFVWLEHEIKTWIRYLIRSLALFYRTECHFLNKFLRHTQKFEWHYTNLSYDAPQIVQRFLFHTLFD